MQTNNLIAYRDYIIDTDTLQYKAVWNCQVEWTDECIFYDAETGRVVIDADEPDFICAHTHKVTKEEFNAHVAELKLLEQVSVDRLKDILSTAA